MTKRGDFGPIYEQFKDKPKEAIRHLKRVKKGECAKALYRKDIGYIDIVWGINNPVTNRGYGLAHIIGKHGAEIKAAGYEVEDFIPIIIEFADFNKEKSETDKRVFESGNFRFVVKTKNFNNTKYWLLTAFVIKKARK